jgi:hypothetical protein
LVGCLQPAEQQHAALGVAKIAETSEPVRKNGG